MTKRTWKGWAIERPDELLYVNWGGAEADNWWLAAGCNNEAEIAKEKANGGRAFRITITEDDPEVTSGNPKTAPRAWHPRVEMRWRVPPETTTKPPVLEQLWQCQQTGELRWCRVPCVEGWEQGVKAPDDQA